MTPASITRSPGLQIYAFPDRTEGFSIADWTTHRVQLVEGTGANTGIYIGELDETKATLWRVFAGASQPTWDQSFAYVDLAEQVALDTLLERTEVGVVVSLTGVVTESGTLTELIIGDDYLAANGRALVWSIPEITGMSVGNATAVFGLRKGEVSVTVNGTVATGDAGEWDVTIEIARTAWGELTEGLAEYSLEIRDSSNGREVTRVINRKDCLVRLRRKAT